MGLKSRTGVDIKSHWSAGIRAYLGTTVAGYPNAFMSYTPFAPTALSNGTTIIEAQCDFACAAIRTILTSPHKIKSIEALPAAEDEWAAYVDAQNANTLYPLTASWWTGANIPGKKTQMLTYLLGIPEYEREMRERLARLEGFDVRYWDGERLARAPAVSFLQTGLVGEKAGAEHVEHVGQAGQVVEAASEVVEILRPTTST